MEENNQTTPNARGTDTAKLRKRILIIFACMVVFIIVAIPLIKMLDGDEGGEDATQGTLPPANLFWESADFDYDIMKDKEYLSLNRQIMFEDTNTGVTDVMDASTRMSHGEAAAVLYDMINCIIAGDTEGYNNLFSSGYLKEEGEHEPFTMQQLYDIRIKSMGAERAGSGQRIDYKFYVDYKIHKNNGTFRQDVGDDESLTQVFTLSDNDGEVRIEGIGYINRK